MNIFTLMRTILVDNDKANESLGKTEGKAESLGSKLGGMAGTAAKWGAAIGGAAIAGGAALFGMASKSAEATDRIDKLSQKIGISREGFQSLEYVLSQNGTDVEKLQVGLKTLTQRMGEAASGTGKGAEAFAKLNLSSTDLQGNLKSQEVMFEEAAKAMMDLPQGAEKSQLAFDLFGKAGLELMPMLNGTAEGMDALKQQAKDMGLVMSDESVAAGVLFTDTMDNVKRSLSAAATNIGVTVMPAIQGILDWVLAHMPQIQQVMKTVFEKIGEFVRIVVDVFTTYLMPALQLIFEWVDTNLPAIKMIFESIFNTIGEIIKAFVQIATTLWNKYGEDIKRITEIAFGAIKTIIETVMGVVKGIINTVMGALTGDWQRAWDGVKQIFGSIWNGMKDLLPQLLDGIYAVLRGAFGVFKDLGSGMFNMIWEGMKGIWGSISSWVGDKVTWLTDKLSFWKKSESQMNKSNVKTAPSRNDGSFFTGLDYVPHNNFNALLHQGERVLTAEENKNLSLGSGQKIENNFNIASVVVREEADIQKIAKELHRLQNRDARSKGMVTA